LTKDASEDFLIWSPAQDVACALIDPITTNTNVT